MMLSGVVLVFLLFSCHGITCLTRSQPAEVKSRRGFFDTHYGQIHYKYGGEFFGGGILQPQYTFLLFHGNPRSIDEFQELIIELNTRFSAPEINAKFSFVAMDLLGEGQSDDAVTDSNNEYVSMQQYAEYMIEIVTSVLSMTSSNDSCNFLGTRYLVPIGSLTGTAIATELSYQLTARNRSHLLRSVGKCEVLTTILHDPMYYFSEEIVANVHSYAQQQRNWQPKENGEHLVDIWNDANYQPYKDLALQDRKSLDRFRASLTQWQVILSYADYSSQYLLGRLINLSKSALEESVSPLTILYGGDFINDPMMDQVFEIRKMRWMIANATQGGLHEVIIDGGNQAALSQNVTVVADIIMQQVVEIG